MEKRGRERVKRDLRKRRTERREGGDGERERERERGGGGG